MQDVTASGSRSLPDARPLISETVGETRTAVNPYDLQEWSGMEKPTWGPAPVIRDGLVHAVERGSLHAVQVILGNKEMVATLDQAGMYDALDSARI